MTAIRGTNRVENMSFIPIEDIQLLSEQRYTANCTLVAVHGGVTTPYNRTTILRRRALPYTTTSAPFTVFN
ncbi:MAG: hypothetical protein ABFR65_04850 [Pseudomonadota bacterium]